MYKYVVEIDGMMCGMCESHMNDIVRRNFEVKKVTSSHGKGETVIITENEIDEDKLREAVEGIGYKMGKMTKGEAKKGLLGWK